ncbi:hypothetical protein F7U66_00910 [Vibrio parahaemolyticus]|nr:hypothetical protein [Vibrio parahaemolyticus]
MEVVDKVNFQIVDLGSVDKSFALKKMRANEPSPYELIIERDGKLIRYSSDQVAVVHYEIWAKAALDRGIGKKFAVVYSAVGPDQEEYLSLALFDGYVCVLDLPRKDVPEFQLKNVPIYFVGSVQNNGPDTVLKVDQYDLRKYKTTNAFEKIKKHKLSIGVTLGVMLVTYGLFSLVSFLNRPEVVIVKEPNYVNVDPYQSYRTYMASARYVNGASEALKFAWVVTHHLPEGWSVQELRLNGNSISTPISHRNGSFFAFDKWLAEQKGLAEFVSRQGQLASLSVPIQPKSSVTSFADKIVNIDQVRDGILEMAQVMGGQVRTKNISAMDNYSRQEIEITFDNVGILGAIELLENINELPVILKDLSTTMRNESAQSSATILLEVVGNVS